MKRFYAHLSLLVLLLSVACGKETPQPAPVPELQGRWNSASTTGYNYSASGQLMSQGNTPDKSFYMVITVDSLIYRDIRDGSFWGSYKYARQGNNIQYGRARCTITELTAHVLTLHFAVPNTSPGTPYQEVEDHYTR